MDFKKKLESELDKRYVEMLNGSSKPPFDKKTVSSYQSFKNKNTSYHQRIDKEQRAFNNALMSFEKWVLSKHSYNAYM